MTIEFLKYSAENPNNVFIACGIMEENEIEHKDVVKYLSKVVDWNKVFSMIATYQHLYNERLVRMLKSHLICRSIETFSNRKLVFVDEIGYDFFCPKNNLKFEFKHGMNIFQSNRSMFTKRIKIDNTEGKSGLDKHHEKTFDYLIIADSNKVGIISYEDVLPYITNVADGRCATIRKDKIIILKESYKERLEKSIFIDDEFEKCIKDLLVKFDNLYTNSK